jgi:hypothetical protein
MLEWPVEEGVLCFSIKFTRMLLEFGKKKSLPPTWATGEFDHFRCLLPPPNNVMRRIGRAERLGSSTTRTVEPARFPEELSPITLLQKAFLLVFLFSHMGVASWRACYTHMQL